MPERPGRAVTGGPCLTTGEPLHARSGAASPLSASAVSLASSPSAVFSPNGPGAAPTSSSTPPIGSTRVPSRSLKRASFCRVACASSLAACSGSTRLVQSPRSPFESPGFDRLLPPAAAHTVIGAQAIKAHITTARVRPARRPKGGSNNAAIAKAANDPALTRPSRKQRTCSKGCWRHAPGGGASWLQY